MVRKVNGKRNSQNSGNGGTAVLEYGARDSRAAGSQAAGSADGDMHGLSQEILRLVEASRQGHLEERGKVESFEGEQRVMMQGINEMLDAILLPIAEGNRILAQISTGKIDELITQTYKGDHEKMKQAVNNVAVVLQGLQKELVQLTDAAKEGKLTERGNPDHFQGAYAGIVRGVNAILDAVITPLNVSAAYVDR